jgi:hypothetical protein
MTRVPSALAVSLVLWPYLIELGTGTAFGQVEGRNMQLIDARGESEQHAAGADAFSRELQQIRVEQGELESKFKNLETTYRGSVQFHNSEVRHTENMMRASGTAPPIEADGSQDHEDGNATPLVALAKAFWQWQRQEMQFYQIRCLHHKMMHTLAHTTELSLAVRCQRLWVDPWSLY